MLRRTFALATFAFALPFLPPWPLRTAQRTFVSPPATMPIPAPWFCPGTQTPCSNNGLKN